MKFENQVFAEQNGKIYDMWKKCLLNKIVKFQYEKDVFVEQSDGIPRGVNTCLLSKVLSYYFHFDVSCNSTGNNM